MTLAQLLAMNNRLTIERLQAAYFDMVRKLKLPATAFTVKLSNACRINGWTDPAYLLNGGEVALKQITSIDGASLNTSFNAPYTLAPLVIGNETGDGFGFADFDDLNTGHTVKPEIFWSGSDLVCTNLDAAFFWLMGYAYPYFVMHTDPYAPDDPHVYDIQSMVDTHGADALTVDPVLLFPVAERALAIAHQEIGDVVGASSLDNLSIQFIAYYNRNPEIIEADFQIQGTAGGPVL